MNHSKHFSLLISSSFLCKELRSMAPCSPLSILLFLSVAATIAAVSYADDFPPPYDFKHVCDPNRYKKLNLSVAKFAFCDKSLPYRARAKNLVDSLTLQEKVTLLGNQNADVQRLGLPRYNWWSEALHGVSNFGGGSRFGKNVPGATSFPLPITSAAAFNEQLWKAIGQVRTRKILSLTSIEHDEEST